MAHRLNYKQGKHEDSVEMMKRFKILNWWKWIYLVYLANGDYVHKKNNKGYAEINDDYCLITIFQACVQLLFSLIKIGALQGHYPVHWHYMYTLKAK